MQSLLPAPIQLLLLLHVRVLSWRRRLAATLRKPSELAGVLVTLAILSFIAVRVWRVDWTVNGPAVLRIFAWYIVILTGIAVVLRVGHILRKGARPLESWEVLGGSSEVDRLVDLMSWAAWIGVAYGVLFLQLAPAVAAGSPIAMRLVALAPGLWISGVVLGEWAGLIVSILASLVARLRVTRAASVVAAMVLDWPLRGPSLHEPDSWSRWCRSPHRGMKSPGTLVCGLSLSDSLRSWARRSCGAVSAGG